MVAVDWDPRRNCVLFNEVPDRVSDAAVLIGAGYAVGSHVVLGDPAASVAIFTAYVRAVGKAMTGLQDYRGPMAKPQRMFVTTIVPFWMALFPRAVHGYGGYSMVDLVLAIVVVGGLITAGRRLGFIARFLSGNNAH